MCMSRPYTLTCILHIYAFRYMAHIIYLDTYIGLPYIPEHAYIQALTHSSALRRTAFHQVVLLESKSGSQTVELCPSKINPWRPRAEFL